MYADPMIVGMGAYSRVQGRSGYNNYMVHVLIIGMI